MGDMKDMEDLGDMEDMGDMEDLGKGRSRRTRGQGDLSSGVNWSA